MLERDRERRGRKKETDKNREREAEREGEREKKDRQKQRQTETKGKKPKRSGARQQSYGKKWYPWRHCLIRTTLVTEMTVSVVTAAAVQDALTVVIGK